jgi:hypothetical protein
MKFVNSVELGDPAPFKQNFIDINLKFLCCRYWYLNLWYFLSGDYIGIKMKEER